MFDYAYVIKRVRVFDYVCTCLITCVCMLDYVSVFDYASVCV